MIKLSKILFEIKVISKRTFENQFNKFKLGDKVQNKDDRTRKGKVIKIYPLKSTSKGYRKVKLINADEIMVEVNNQPNFPSMSNFVLRYFFNPKNDFEKKWNETWNKTEVVKSINEIKIVKSNFIKKINNFEEFLNLAPLFPKEFKRKEFFNLYQDSGKGLYVLFYEGKKYFFSGKYLGKDIVNEENKEILEPKLRKELINYIDANNK